MSHRDFFDDKRKSLLDHLPLPPSGIPQFREIISLSAWAGDR